ncbi:dipeptidase [Jiangella endophytica]|uniref:dipeptidase n=1 Tax=Jiangella endophytica TaxID=1623398 RepID=UPI000E354E26|nr:membrane dipeptidase [Jiangella endophytica]
MINNYVGPTVGLVMDGHRLDPTAQVLRRDHLPAWRAGGLTGAVMQVSDWNTLGMLMSEIHRSEGEIVFVRNRSEFENRPPGSFGLFLSVEGYTSFAGDFDALHVLAELGVIAFTFSHNVQNVLCTGCNDRAGEGGFTHLGKATLKELESSPMMVDLVHMSRASFWDALDLYDGDVFVSHANSDAICPHTRNLTDDQIKAVAERNGVIGLTTYRGYVSADPYAATLSDLLDHAMHMYDLVGAEHLSIGADYSGPATDEVPPMLRTAMEGADPENTYGLGEVGPDLYTRGPKGIEDASRLNKLLVGLAERGLDHRELDLIAGGSYLAMVERARPSVNA